MEEKKYGLIRLSKSDKPKTTLKTNIFDSDSDEEIQGKPNVKTSSVIKRQTHLDINRALTEDPNVFEYDSIYDEMKSNKESFSEIDSKNKEKPKPKYINNLLKFSENRKKENERRIERKIQKEREEEGNQFQDKEQFVTNAYKEKLNEMKAADEAEKREAAIEDLLDVRKQKDLSGFYRNLYNNSNSSQKETPVIETNPPNNESVDEDVDEVNQEINEKIAKVIPKQKLKRQFRRRRSSSEESSNESPERSKPKIEENVNQRLETKVESNSQIRNSETNEQNLNKSFDSKENSFSEEKNETNNELTQEMNKNKTKKIDKRELLLKLFTKRTVGDVFTEAQMRYFQRKDNYII